MDAQHVENNPSADLPIEHNPKTLASEMDLSAVKSPLLDHIANAIVEHKLPVLDVSMLKFLATSSDKGEADKALRMLRTKWNSDPTEQDKRIKTVDIMEQFGKYSQEERRSILSNIVAIQLTKGCKGDCPFCLFGQKKGVEEKYSFQSIKNFFKEYKSNIDTNIAFYWDSDPFDWEDGDKTFVDIYKVYRESFPQKYMYISTTIPKGSQESFIEFMRYAAKEYINVTKDTFSDAYIRISLAKHNASRVDATLKQLVTHLKTDGLSNEQISDFFMNAVFASDRFDSQIVNMGALIHKHDDYSEMDNPACRDGVVFTPDKIKAIAVTAPTMYESSGQWEHELIPGEAEGLIPRKMFVPDFEMPDTETELLTRMSEKDFMLPNIRRFDNYDLLPQDPVERYKLLLGRNIYSLGLTLETISYLYNQNNLLKVDETDKEAFIRQILTTHTRRQPQYEQYISEVEIAITNANEADKKMLEYYKSLFIAYKTKMDFLELQVNEGTDIRTIASMSSVLDNVGKDEIVHLPKIMEGLLEIDEAFSRVALVSQPKEKIEKTVRQVLGKYFPDGKVEKLQLFEDVVSVYVKRSSDTTVFSLSKRYINELLKKMGVLN